MKLSGQLPKPPCLNMTRKSKRELEQRIEDMDTGEEPREIGDIVQEVLDEDNQEQSD